MTPVVADPPRLGVKRRVQHSSPEVKTPAAAKDN